VVVPIIAATCSGVGSQEANRRWETHLVREQPLLGQYHQQVYPSVIPSS
jgi:hypothetical protein